MVKAIMGKNLRKTENLTNLWHRLGGPDNGVSVEGLLRGLNGERDFCVHGNLDPKRRQVQVAEVGANLVNRLGECYRVPADEPGIAAAVMLKLSSLGEKLLAEQSPQIRDGEIARAGHRIHYRLAAVPALDADGGGLAWLGIVDWSRRPV
jgi:hypothetical protein